MAVELTVRAATVEDIVTERLQSALRSQCPAPWGPVSVDHVDVPRAAVAVRLVDGQVVLEATAHLFLTSSIELAAHPNADPPGALQPAATMTVRYALRATVTGAAAALHLDPLDPDGPRLPQPLTPLEPTVRAWMTAQQRPLEVPLDDFLRQLRLPAPCSATTTLTDGVIIAAFDPGTPPTSRIAPSEQWAAFLDRTALDAMARELFAPALLGEGASAGAHLERIDWAPVNGHPVIKVRIGSRPTITAAGVTVTAHVWVDVVCGLALIPAPVATSQPSPGWLRTNVSWSVHVDLPGPLSLGEGIVEAEVERRVRRQFKPADYGGQPTGERSFVIDEPFEAPSFFEATAEVATLQGLPDGLLLTGRIRRPRTAPSESFAIEPGTLTPPLRVQFCSELAKSGDGRSRTPQTIENSHTTATVRLRGVGALCSWEVLPPNDKLVQPFVGLTTVDDTVDVNVQIPYATALKMTESLRIRVATSRGVRLFDLGLPPRTRVDEAGTILDGWDWYIPNCLHLTPEQRRGRPYVGWGLDEGRTWTADRFRKPPLEDPDWADYATAGQGLSVQLVTITGLESGEVVQLRSPSHAIDVTSDAAGRASIPVLLPVSDSVAPTLLQRASGAPLPASVDVATVDLRRVAQLDVVDNAPDDGPEPTFESSVAATVSALGLANRVDIPALMVQLAEDVFLNPQPLPPKESGEETELNPQPLPPHPDDLRERLGLADLADVIPVPGFETAPVVIAVLADERKLVIDLTDGARVAGTFRGPIGPVRRSGRWAVAEGTERLGLLHLRQ